MTCPNCGQPIDVQDRKCSQCGIDMALAANLASIALAEKKAIAQQTVLAPEIFVPRLGERLVENGFITQEQMRTALDHHLQMTDQGSKKLFGQVLLDMGLISREMLDRVVTEQILQLQQALRESNQVLERRVQQRTIDLQNALDKLSELNELKSNFISNISHELRTPLTHIKGYLVLFSDGTLGPLNQDQQYALRTLMRAEMRLESLIEDLIQFSLTARGSLSLNLKPVSLGDLMRSVQAKGERLAVAREVLLEMRIPERNSFIRADLEKMSWVLLQLQDNAIKFTNHGGKVSLIAEREEGLVTFTIRDTGIGIPEKRLTEIFEPFHQLDGSDSRNFGGTGLGLALVKKIIEAHGSAIHVQSVPGKGSEFSFSLPVENIVNG